MKPILFNTVMVRAILDGVKSSTRRPLKQPFEVHPNGYITKPKGNERLVPYEPPYRKGDILYVRETWKVFEKRSSDGMEIKKIYGYKADKNDYSNPSEFYEGNWKPSIHMPKEAARIFLKVIDIRVERLQDMPHDGCLKEGVRSYTKDGNVIKFAVSYDQFEWSDMPRTPMKAFEKLWDSCYDFPYCWSANPFVWVIEFERIEKPVERS